MKELIHIYYTNDLHSNFKYWPQVATYMKEERRKKSADHKTHIRVDVGDHVDRVNPIAEAYLGKGNISLMNDLGYDFVTLGNNEGITLSRENLYELYEDANFSVICSNLQSKDSVQPDWLFQQAQVETVNGVTIGFLGLTAPYKEFYNLLGWKIDPPFDALEQHVDDLKATSDVIILLSHLGINEDRAIARNFPEIDVIIGGHTHHLLRTGEYVRETLITAAGKYCTHVGEVILTWDHSAGELFKKEAYTTQITHLEPDQATTDKLEFLSRQTDQLLNKPIATIQETLHVNWYEPTKIMEQLTDTLTEYTEAECGMLNSGLLLDSFHAGTITYGDVHRICPHPISPAVVCLRGDELLEVIRVTLTKQFMEFHLKGLGFRGKALGRMVFSNLDVETKRLSNGELSVKSVLHEGKPLQADKIYKIATADSFTFGRLLPIITKSKNKQYFLPEMIRDLLVDTFKKHYT